MPGKNTSFLLPELRRIEAIIENNQQRLGSQILGNIQYKNYSFPIYALSLGNPDCNTPSLTFVGGIHGLERIGTQVILAFLETLLAQLQWNTTIAEMLEKVKINFIPLVNPVGMLKHTRANGQGIDLMRNADIDSNEKTLWLAGGHRISPKLPWYRGKLDEPMQLEAQILCDFISDNVFPAPFSLILDCHSGFGFHNQIWFPYAKSRTEQILHLGEIFCLRRLFMQTYPYQNYHFEPQSLHYLTHGDLWDYLYLQSLTKPTIFLPLTLEMGSWRWVRKNPLQLRKSLGLFHPIKPHRIDRVLRGHQVLMNFLLHATLSNQKWLNDCDTQSMKNQALALWYHEKK